MVSLVVIVSERSQQTGEEHSALISACARLVVCRPAGADGGVSPWTDISRNESQNRRLGVENGAERRPPPGIQAQRPAPAHRTHDTTDQWRDLRLRLGRSAAYFPTLLPNPKKTSRVSGEYLASIRSF